jgi:hypothetical protein
MKNSAAIGLHVVPQYTYHADASIVGTREALVALRDAISYALKCGEAQMDTFASDGEGYTLTVRKIGAPAFHQEKPYYSFLNEN